MLNYERPYRYCDDCDVWHNMNERRASEWAVNEDCDFCWRTYQRATQPIEYIGRQRELRAAITRAKQIERDALRKDNLEVKRQARAERAEDRKVYWSVRRCALELKLDPEEMWERYQAHDKRCEICGTHEDDLPTRLCMDHCHETGEFRGWLCKPCNSGIGHLGDSADRVAAALKYLGG